MTPTEITQINKESAEALAWPLQISHSNNRGWRYYVPPIDFSFNHYQVKEMHFHDSYDWAFLLVKKVLEFDEKHRGCTAHYPMKEFFKNLLKDSFGYSDNADYFNLARFRHCFTATPLQITLACLEALRDE